jgi:uncharacterized RDD family membrane protein YckC
VADQPLTDIRLASLGRRFAALLIDWVLCLLIARFFKSLTGPAWQPLIPSLILVVEYAFFLGLFGQTPGMRVTRIRCASVRDGGVIGVPRAALRGLLLVLVVPGLLMDRQRRGWHDKAAGSVMLSAEASETSEPSDAS